MFRVIDTIKYDEALFRQQPGLAQRFGHGLLAILDPAQVTSAPVQPGDTVRIRRPDGSSFVRAVSDVDVTRSIVGLFFLDTAQHEIPRDS